MPYETDSALAAVWGTGPAEGQHCSCMTPCRGRHTGNSKESGDNGNEGDERGGGAALPYIMLDPMPCCWGPQDIAATAATTCAKANNRGKRGVKGA